MYKSIKKQTPIYKFNKKKRTYKVRFKRKTNLQLKIRRDIRNKFKYYPKYTVLNLNRIITFNYRHFFLTNFHLGFERTRWEPKLIQYFWGIRNNMLILKLTYTMFGLKQVFSLFTHLLQVRKSILFISENIFIDHLLCKMIFAMNQFKNIFFSGFRWLGGLLSNKKTVLKSITLFNKVNAEKYSKIFKGIYKINSYPALAFILNSIKSTWAINEINKVKVASGSILDSLGSKLPIFYPILGNTTSFSSQLFFLMLCRQVINFGLSLEYLLFKRKIRFLKIRRLEAFIKKKANSFIRSYKKMNLILNNKSFNYKHYYMLRKMIAKKKIQINKFKKFIRKGSNLQFLRKLRKRKKVQFKKIFKFKRNFKFKNYKYKKKYIIVKNFQNFNFRDNTKKKKYNVSKFNYI